MEASALPASVGLARARLGLGAPLLRLRSDEQLVSLFRAGNEDAFRVIHDRYRSRMLAYARQMLASSPADAEDAVQEIFVRAYAGLRANRRDLALRAWLYRIAHNRCVDDLRRPHAIAVESVEELGETGGPDPHARAEQREALRRLIADVQRLPEQQRSALLMRELGGMPYADLAGALGVSVPAVKSLLVRARVGLVQASEARDTACDAIREDLIGAHDRGVRASGRARRHLRDCPECRRFRGEVQGVSRRLGLLVPALGPVAVLAKLVGLGGGGGAAAGSSTGAAATSGAAAAGTTAVAASGGAAAGVGASGAVISAGAAAGAGHVAAVVAATVIAAGGAIGIQHAVSSGHPAGAAHARVSALAQLPQAAPAPAARDATPAAAGSSDRTAGHAGSTAATSRVSSNGKASAGAGAGTTDSTPGVASVTHLSTTSGSGSSTGATTTSGTTTSPTTTATTTTGPTTTATTSGTTTSGTTTTPSSGTATPPTSGTTTVPISGSSNGQGGDPGTSSTGSTTPTSTGTASGGNPGTATGIVPIVTSATPATGFGSRPRHPRTWHYGLRGIAPSSSVGN